MANEIAQQFESLPDSVKKLVNSTQLERYARHAAEGTVSSLEDAGNSAGDAIASLNGLAVRRSELIRCCEAGMWLLIGELDQSHKISQMIKSPEGSFWHAIMHRLEQDYWNSKYWYRQVGQHETHSLMKSLADRNLGDCSEPAASKFLADSSWDPEWLVDLCADTNQGDNASFKTCQTLCRIEWQVLYYYCFENGVAQ